MTSVVLPSHAAFRSNAGARTITGLIVEWGYIAPSGGRRFRFAPGSISWPPTVGRVKLNLDHKSTELVGVATDLTPTPRGIVGTFRIARGPEGDRVLEMAEDGVLDGFSVEVDFVDEGDFGPDPSDRSVTLVTRAMLRAVAITGSPAFDNARLESVMATRLPDVHVTEELASQVRGFVDARQTTFADVARSALTAYTAPNARVVEPCPYRFGGTSGPSLIADVWESMHTNDTDAMTRLERFRGWQADVTTRLERADVAFDVIDTDNASAIMPPGYQPAPFVGVAVADRPFVALGTQVPLTSSTPFTLPTTVTPGGMAPHTEGVNPTQGVLGVVGTQTVTPKGQSGTFRLTREVADAANPAIDAVVMSAMREDYAAAVEVEVYAQLNGSGGQGGTITAGAVPSGARVVAATGDLGAALKAALAGYAFGRGRRPRNVVVSAEGAEALSEVLDETTGDEAAMWRVLGAAVNPGPAATGNAAGDADVFVLGTDDLYVWERPLLSFRWQERVGPAYIDLALWGSFAARLLRPVGLSAIRYTAA